MWAGLGGHTNPNMTRVPVPVAGPGLAALLGRAARRARVLVVCGPPALLSRLLILTAPHSGSACQHCTVTGPAAGLN